METKLQIENYPQCEHLECFDVEDYQCKKRYYKIIDFKRKEIYKLGVCNDLLRVKLMDEKIKGTYYRHSYSDVVEGIIRDHIGSRDPITYGFIPVNSRSPLNPYISFIICERPWIFGKISLTDAFRYLGENVDYWDFLWTSGFYTRLQQGVHELATYMKKYTKYKVDHSRLDRIVRNFKASRFEFTASDTIVELFELMIKYNINNINDES